MASRGQKRTPLQHDRDIMDIVLLLAECVTQQDVTDRLNEKRPYKLSRQQVSDDIVKAKELYLKRITETAGRKRDAEADRLLRAAALMHVSFERSKFVTKKGRKIKGPGDPRYMAVVVQSLAERARILGLHKPDEMEPPPPPGSVDNYFQVSVFVGERKQARDVNADKPMTAPPKQLDDIALSSETVIPQNPVPLTKTGRGRIFVKPASSTA